MLQGGCQRRGGQEPYAPLLDALQRHLRGGEPDQLPADLQGCAWLVRLLPELADGPIPPLPPWTLTPEQERRLTGEAVLRFLTNVAGPTGTVLLLDDLQWAGPDALDLLATLARSGAEVPLRIIGAYRDTEVHAQDTLVGPAGRSGPRGAGHAPPARPAHGAPGGAALDELWEGAGRRRRARCESRCCSGRGGSRSSW